MIIEREKSRRRVLSGHPLERRLPPRRRAASSQQRGRWWLPPDPVRHHRRTRGPSGWTLPRLGRFERHGWIHLGPWWRGLHYALGRHHDRARLILAWRGHDHLHRRYAALGQLFRDRHGGGRSLSNLRGRGSHHGRRRVGQRGPDVGTTPTRNRGDSRRRRLSRLKGETLLGRQPQGVTRPQEPAQR